MSHPIPDVCHRVFNLRDLHNLRNTRKRNQNHGNRRWSIDDVPGGGSAAIYGPDGRQLTDDLSEHEEGLVMAGVNIDKYSRLGVSLTRAVTTVDRTFSGWELIREQKSMCVTHSTYLQCLNN